MHRSFTRKCVLLVLHHCLLHLYHLTLSTFVNPMNGTHKNDPKHVVKAQGQGCSRGRVMYEGRSDRGSKYLPQILSHEFELFFIRQKLEVDKNALQTSYPLLLSRLPKAVCWPVLRGTQKGNEPAVRTLPA